MMKKKQLNIAVVWANPYSGNKGVAALAYSIMYLFKQIEVENNLDIKFLMIGSEGYSKDIIQIGNFTINFANIPKMDLMNIKSLLKIVYYTKGRGLLNILKLDYVFDISEGDSFSDIYGLQRFNLIYNSKKYFNLLRKKQFLLPQTIGPFANIKVKNKAFNLIKKINCICARDKQSYNFVCENIKHNEVYQNIDVAFALPFEKQIFNNDQTNIGLNISGLLWNGGYTKNNQFNLKANYQELILSIIEYFVQIKKVKIHLIGHVFSKTESIEDDHTINLFIKNKYPQFNMSPIFQNPVESKSYISGLDFFIGSRMHTCIAAFSAGIPVFPLAYSRKFNGLFTDTLKYSYIGDCVNQDNPNILKELAIAFSKKNILMKEINESLDIIIAPNINELKFHMLSFLSS